MPPHDVRKLVRDMQRFIKELEEFLGGCTVAELKEDVRSLRAVEMQFILIAEVLKRMEKISSDVPCQS